jgi:hypothetical protein
MCNRLPPDTAEASNSSLPDALSTIEAAVARQPLDVLITIEVQSSAGAHYERRTMATADMVRGVRELVSSKAWNR